jgi:hypothetical protein
MAAWNALSEVERKAREQEGIAAWKSWAQRHAGAIVTMGGPLGKTKKISATGIGDTTNAMGAFTLCGPSRMRPPQSFSSITTLDNLPGGSHRSNAHTADPRSLSSDQVGRGAVDFTAPPSSQPRIKPGKANRHQGRGSEFNVATHRFRLAPSDPLRLLWGKGRFRA